MRCRAVKQDDAQLHHRWQEELDHFRAGRALCAVVRHERSRQARAQLFPAFMIDTKRDGFSCGKTEPKLGIIVAWATCEDRV